MSNLQERIDTEVKEYIKQIEHKRYTSEDPFIEISEKDSKIEVMIKLLTAARTAAAINYRSEIINPNEGNAKSNFYSGISALKRWQFRRSQRLFDDAANLARDPLLQQQINLFKQLQELLQGCIYSSPELLLKRKKRYFEEVLESLPKYDLLSENQQKHYEEAITSLLTTAERLSAGETFYLSQLYMIRCEMALYHHEYLAAYFWLFKIYLLNKKDFDVIAKKDTVLAKALQNLKLYLEEESGLVETTEEVPRIASAFDLKDIFIDHLTTIYNAPFKDEMQKYFTFTTPKISD
ncbi:MAG: hypothetical protein U9O98_11010 [Asgard group archaeon]|nr:hypothetical protein [Asgard group archaeon]